MSSHFKLNFESDNEDNVRKTRQLNAVDSDDVEEEEEDDYWKSRAKYKKIFPDSDEDDSRKQTATLKANTDDLAKLKLKEETPIKRRVEQVVKPSIGQLKKKLIKNK